MADFSKINETVSQSVIKSKRDLENSLHDQKLKKEAAYSLLKKLGNRPDKLVNKKYQWQGENISFDIDDFWLCQVDEITFVDKAPQKEGVENILGTFRGLRGFNFVYMILGSPEKTCFYLGVAKDKVHAGRGNFSVEEVGEKLLRPAIQGNFRGCKLKTVTDESDEGKTGMLSKSDILARLHNQDFHVSMMDGVPSVNVSNNHTSGGKENFQSIDRLVDVMQGCYFGVVVIARPCSAREADELGKNLYAAVNSLSPITKYSLQYAKNINLAHNDNSALSTSKQNSHTTQKSQSDSYSHTEGHSSDYRRDIAKQIAKSCNDTSSSQFAHNKSYGYSRDVGNGGKDREDMHQTADDNNHSVQKSTGNNYNFSTNENNSQSKSENNQHSDSHSKSDSTGLTISSNDQLSFTESSTENSSLSEQLEIESKAAADWLKYIDEVLLPRLDNGNGKGIFNVCTYLFAESEISLKRLSNTAISLYSGPTGNKAALRSIRFDQSQRNSGCNKLLSNFQIPAAIVDHSHTPYETLISMITGKNSANQEIFFCGSWMSANELGLMTGFPQREIIGLKLREEVEFGLNSTNVKLENRIDLGHMVQCGREIDTVRISLDKTELDKHTFIAGVTGSGKTTTCQNILIACQIPFLVVEPAKTEYRALNNHPELRDKGIIYFTPGKQGVAPFFLNPFELFPGEEISSRADMLKATFEASFEMEAAIPQIMGTAIYTAYENKGWNTSTTTWQNKAADAPDGPFADGVYAFPTLSDFKIAVKKVIEKQGFDDRLREEYLGSINARIESLMIGAKGQMLNTPRSIDFRDLVTKRVVIELEEIKSGSEKSLIMGLLMTNLLQAVKIQNKEFKKEKKQFRHITLVEEAHRLLSRYMPGDNRNQKQGVEVFSDMLAEVRKYGESLIIVDQIPDKMTPEVLKNTNTKIVHKLFAKDDKDAIGNTMSLSDEQKNFLSNLPPGRAVVFSQGWDKAVQVQVDKKSNTSDNDIDEEEIYQRSLRYYASPEVARRGVVPGLQDIPANQLTPEIAGMMLWLRQQSYQWLDEWKERVISLLPPVPSEPVCDNISLQRKEVRIIEGIREALSKISSEQMTKYIYNSFKDIVFDEDSFFVKTEELLLDLRDLTKPKDGIKILRDYNASLKNEDICKLF